MNKKLLLMVVIVFCIFTAGISQVYLTDDSPHRITLNLITEPATSMTVTWRTLGEVEKPQVQFGVATDSTNLELRADSIDAVSEKVILGSATSVFHHSAIMKNLNQWTIAAVHQPFFSMGRNRDGCKTRDAFMALVDRYSVDLVLTVHDHVYSRSYKLRNGEKVSDDEPGTVYVVSVCGSKAYSLNKKYRELMQKTGSEIQLFQVISIDGNKLSYKVYTVTGSLFDSLILNFFFDQFRKKIISSLT